MVFETIIETMIDMNLFELFFPWLLTLAVTYGVLDKYEYFEDSVNAIVALAVSFIAIGGAYLFVPATLFPHFAAVIAFGAFGMIGIMILMALAGIDLNELDSETPLSSVVLGLGILVIAGVLLWQFDLVFEGGQNFDEVVTPIITLLFMLGVVAAITRSS